MALAQPALDRLAPAILDRLDDRLVGDLVLPDDEGYEPARRVWNAEVDRRPAAILYAAGASDVARGLVFAREHDLAIAVRGGGHSMAGHGVVDGGLVIDLSRMKRTMVDPVARVAWADAGLRAGEYLAATERFGLATPHGDTATVGIAGLTLGGGIGYLARRHGLTVDHVRSIQVVTAEGRLVTADRNEHADLFWALRGGGGNFGVATGFEYDLVPVDPVYGGALLLPATQEVLEAYVELADAAPDELTTIANLMPAPPAPFIAAPDHGRLALAILAIHLGDPAAGERALAPFRALAAPIADTLAPMPYSAIYAYTREAGEPHTGSVRSGFLDDLRPALDPILRAMEEPGNGAMVQLRVLGGQMARADADETAFAHRSARGMVMLTAGYRDPADREARRAWVDRLWGAVRPHTRGAYVNFLQDEGEARVAEAYGPGAFARLRKVKARYDPANVFRCNENIPPA